MKFIYIFVLLIFSISSYSITINVSGVVEDLNNSPIQNHRVVIEVIDTTTFYSSIDSVLTNATGNYSYTISNAGISQTAKIIITTHDCVGALHTLNAFPGGGSNYNFQICAGGNPSQCIAQFTFFEDTIISGTFHFINQSTNNTVNIWKVNGNIISQQVDFTYTFNTNPSSNTVCLEIINYNQTCNDSKCTTVIVNYCNTSFTSVVSGLNVEFVANSSPSADYYVWDFDDGSSQTITNDTIQHLYTTGADYNVKLTAYNIYAQDTCSAIDSSIVSLYPVGQLIGYVFTGNTYLDVANVVLYKKNIADGKLLVVETTSLETDTNTMAQFYQFNNKEYGEYYIKCIISENSAVYTQYIDTWASQDANMQIVSWQGAEMQSLNSDQQVANINLKKAEVIFTGGEGVIEGSIDNTVGVNTSNQIVFLLNHERKIVKTIHPQQSGNFVFDSLISGIYYLRPELTNYYSLDYMVELNSNNSVVDDVQIAIDDNHYYTSVNNISNSMDITVYPNPVSDELFIHIPTDYHYDNVVKIDIYNSIGEHIYSQMMEFKANSILNIPFFNKKNGMYIVKASGTYGVFVKKIIKLGATN